MAYSINNIIYHFNWVLPGISVKNCIWEQFQHNLPEKMQAHILLNLLTVLTYDEESVRVFVTHRSDPLEICSVTERSTVSASTLIGLIARGLPVCIANKILVWQIDISYYLSEYTYIYDMSLNIHTYIDIIYVYVNIYLFSCTLTDPGPGSYRLE